MEPIKNINLIKASTDTYPQLGALTSFLTKASIGSLAILLVSGLIVGGVYVFIQNRVSSLTQKKQTLITAITGEQVKEGLLVSVKDRVVVIDKLSKDQKNISTFFTLINNLAPEDKIDSIAIDDINKSTLTVHLDSISEAATIVDNLMKAVSSKKANKPELISLSLGEEGGFIMAVSFVPIM